MIRWMRGLILKESKENTNLRELLRPKPFSLKLKNGRLRWFGYAERKNVTDWVMQCTMMELDSP